MGPNKDSAGAFIRKYLEACKEKIKASEILISIGSEACDPDSFVCSLIMAIHEKAIPVINMPRCIFESKGDLAYLCSLFNLSADDFIYFETPKGKFSLQARILGSSFKVGNKSYKLEDKKVRLILVDHHRPVEELRHCELDMIVDHHALASSALLAKRIYVDIEMGSCCTLVSKVIGHSLVTGTHPKNEHFDEPQVCREFAKMLAIPIFLDTNRFRKVTSHFDRGEFKKLIKMAGVKKREMKEVVKRIKKERQNDKDLSTETILLKDFKRFDESGTVFGYSTVKYSFKKWVTREGGESNGKAGSAFEAALHTFKRDYGLDFLLVNRKAGKKRFLILVGCPYEKKLMARGDFFPRDFKGLQYYEVPVELSRKILTPVIKEMIRKAHE